MARMNTDEILAGREIPAVLSNLAALIVSGAETIS